MHYEHPQKRSHMPILFSSTEDAHVLRVQVPGATRETIQLKVEDGILDIAYENTMEMEGEEMKYSEWESEKRERRLELPKDADVEAMTAHVDKGILTVRMGRKHAKTIEIQ